MAVLSSNSLHRVVLASRMAHSRLLVLFFALNISDGMQQ